MRVASSAVKLLSPPKNVSIPIKAILVTFIIIGLFMLMIGYNGTQEAILGRNWMGLSLMGSAALVAVGLCIALVATFILGLAQRPKTDVCVTPEKIYYKKNKEILSIDNIPGTGNPFLSHLMAEYTTHRPNSEFE